MTGNRFGMKMVKTHDYDEHIFARESFLSRPFSIRTFFRIELVVPGAHTKRNGLVSERMSGISEMNEFNFYDILINGRNGYDTSQI